MKVKVLQWEINWVRIWEIALAFKRETWYERFLKYVSPVTSLNCHSKKKGNFVLQIESEINSENCSFIQVLLFHRVEFWFWSILKSYPILSALFALHRSQYHLSIFGFPLYYFLPKYLKSKMESINSHISIFTHQCSGYQTWYISIGHHPHPSPKKDLIPLRLRPVRTPPVHLILGQEKRVEVLISGQLEIRLDTLHWYHNSIMGNDKSP